MIYISASILYRQSWPTKTDMHQDIEDSLAASSISHAGGPQSPARSVENLLNGHRNKGLLDLSRREESSEACGTAAYPGQVTSLTQNPLKPSTTAPPAASSAKQRTCLFRVEEDEEEEEEQEPAPLPMQVILRRKPPSVTNRLTSRKSAPVLNQIFEEEGESDDDDFNMDESLPPKLSRLKMNMTSPGTAQKRFRRKSQGRGSSCSSSETSDDDSESHRRRLDKESGFTYKSNRRDSSEGPPGNSGGNGGGGSSGGQSKPSGEGNSGPDRGGNGGGGGSGNAGEGGGSKGQGSPSSCSSGSSNPSSGSTRTAARSTGELMESLKLMSLCLSSQLQHRRSGGGGGRFIMDPQSLSSVRVQEKSSWKMCIGSTSSLEKTLNVGGGLMNRYPDQTTAMLNELALAKENNLNLKANVLQLPLCEKTISVNIQRSPRDGLLCTSAQASCCQVI